MRGSNSTLHRSGRSTGVFGRKPFFVGGVNGFHAEQPIALGNRSKCSRNGKGKGSGSTVSKRPASVLRRDDSVPTCQLR